MRHIVVLLCVPVVNAVIAAHVVDAMELNSKPQELEINYAFHPDFGDIAQLFINGDVDIESIRRTGQSLSDMKIPVQVQFGLPAVDDEVFKVTIGIKRLQALVLSPQSLSEAQFVRAATLPGLKSLAVYASKAELENIDKCAPSLNIETLTIHKTDILDQKLNANEKADASQFAIPCECWKAISKLPKLSTLVLDGVAAECILSTGELPSIKTLWLCNEQVTPDLVTNLARSAGIECLGISQSTIKASALNDLTRLVNMRRLCLMWNRSQEGEFACIENCRSLQELDVSNASISRSDLLSISKSSQLRILRITLSRFDDEEISLISQMPHLKRLKCSTTEVFGRPRLKPSISSSQLKSLREKLPQVTIEYDHPVAHTLPEHLNKGKEIQ